VVHDRSRRSGLSRTAAEWIVFLDDDDEPDDEMLDVLVAAQAASGADLVTPAVRPSDDPRGVHLFLGDPGALGLVENQYGVVGLVRASLAVSELPADGAVDPDWLLFARLALSGARILSVPKPLATYSGKPGHVADIPGEGLAVLEAFEDRPVAELRDLPQLAAILAAAYAGLQRRASDAPMSPPVREGVLTRLTSRRRRRGSRP
jgi:hypothetical protein